MQDFEKGDVVRLKSGGPKMTVQEVGAFSSRGIEDGALCVWFNDKKELKEEVFATAALEQVEQEQGSSVQAPMSF